MCEAGRIILDGFELRTDADVVVYPDRYEDERGVEMWGRVNGILAELIRRDSFDQNGKEGTPDEFLLCENFMPSDTRETGPVF